MNPRPCEEHNIWSDFPGSNDWKCVRCGWSEKQLEVRMLEWMLDGKEPGPKLRLVSTSAPPEKS